MMEQDTRLVVRFGSVADAGNTAALLIENGAATPRPGAAAVAHFALPSTAHAIGCACCLPRGPASVALGRLFLARARGEAPLFDTVVAVISSPAAAAAVRAALADDVVTRARFRLASDQLAPD
jgi:hypothetical protein